MTTCLVNVGRRSTRIHASTERNGVLLPRCGGGRGGRSACYQTDLAGIVTCQVCLALQMRATPP